MSERLQCALLDIVTTWLYDKHSHYIEGQQRMHSEPYWLFRPWLCSMLITACIANGVPTVDKPQPQPSTFDDCHGSPNPADAGEGCI